MVMHRFLTIRMRKEHLERIKNAAEAKGYENLSEYIRSMILSDDTTLHQKVTAMYNVIIGKESMKPKLKEKPLTAFIR